MSLTFFPDRLLELHEANGLSTIQHTEKRIRNYLFQAVSSPIAIAACRIQNNFKSFDRIVIDLANECSDDELDAYAVVALARFCYSTGVRRSVLSASSGQDSIEFLLSDGASLPLKYSDRDASFVVPRQAVVADRFLMLLKRDQPRRLLGAFIGLANALAPRVSPATISKKTPEAQMLGRLMDFDNNVHRFIDEFAEEYYESVKPLNSWNARYWEQLSLLKLDRYAASPQDRMLLEESIQHAKAAVSKEAHPFSLTTLAKVLFRAMSNSPNAKEELFDEAWAHIAEANRLESRWRSRGAALFIVAFRGVSEFLKMGGQLSGEQSELLRDMIATTHSYKMRDKYMRDLRGEIEEAV